MDLIVRVAVMTDLPRVAEIFRDASLSNEGDRENLLAHPAHLVFVPTPIAERRTLVAAVDGELVGFVTTQPAEPAWEIEDLFVDPAWMRRGIATRLVTEAVSAARSANGRRIEVTGNRHALAFYESAGFLLDGEVGTELGLGLRLHLDVPPA